MDRQRISRTRTNCTAVLICFHVSFSNTNHTKAPWHEGRSSKCDCQCMRGGPGGEVSRRPRSRCEVVRRPGEMPAVIRTQHRTCDLLLLHASPRLLARFYDFKCPEHAPRSRAETDNCAVMNTRPPFRLVAERARKQNRPQEKNADLPNSYVQSPLGFFSLSSVDRRMRSSDPIRLI